MRYNLLYSITNNQIEEKNGNMGCLRNKAAKSGMVQSNRVALFKRVCGRINKKSIKYTKETGAVLGEEKNRKRKTVRKLNKEIE